MSVIDVLEMCSFKISKVGNIFEENKDKILDHLMDKIQLTWKLSYNELTHNNKSENLKYCETNLNEKIYCRIFK